MKGKNINMSMMKFIAIIFTVFVIGFLINGGSENNKKLQTQDTHNHKKEVKKEWTCSMHPQIRSKKKGKCSLCGMDLIIVESGTDDNRPLLKLSKAAIKLADIRTERVEFKKISVLIQVTGQIETSEVKTKYITAWTDGRIEKMYADSTGILIRKGKPLVKLYSPEIIIAKEELLQTEPSSKNRNSAKMKLKLLGFSKNQIDSILKNKKVSNFHSIIAPISGTIIKKNISEGAYVKRGQKLYTIADLTKLWVVFDVYEQDLGKVYLGQKVIFETEVFNGLQIESIISFIEPVLDKKNRTVRVRAEIVNNNGRLKPDMFVRGEIRAETNTEILLIPDTAPLITGKRAIVYVLRDKKKGIFEGKQILLGAKAENSYIVLRGLNKNDMVVINGAFKIDSDLQLRGKPSMMSMDEEVKKDVFGTGSHDNGLFKLDQNKGKIYEISERLLKSLVKSYFNIQRALSGDDLKKSGIEAKKLLKLIEANGDNYFKYLLISVKGMAKSKDIEKARVLFEPFTKEITAIIDKSKIKFEKSIYRFHCPMAFDNRGAYWLQDNEDTRNPYYGSSMLICKDEVIELFPKKNKGK